MKRTLIEAIEDKVMYSLLAEWFSNFESLKMTSNEFKKMLFDNILISEKEKADAVKFQAFNNALKLVSTLEKKKPIGSCNRESATILSISAFSCDFQARKFEELRNIPMEDWRKPAPKELLKELKEKDLAIKNS